MWYIGTACVIAALAAAPFAAAQFPGAEGTPQKVSDIGGVPGFVSLIDTVVDWIFTILLIAAVLMVIVAAFQFVTAGGSSEAVNSARMKIMWAIVGILLAFGAQAIVLVVEKILGGEQEIVETAEPGPPPPGPPPAGEPPATEPPAEEPPPAVAPETFGVSPASWDFGTILLEERREKQFTVVNNTEEAIVLKDTRFVASGPYSVRGFSKGNQLDPGETATFTVRFEPESKAVFENTLIIETDPAARELALRLVGEGVDAQLQAQLGTNQDAIQRADPGQQVAWDITITNTGKSEVTGKLTFSNPSFDCQNCAYTLAPAESQQARVVFDVAPGTRGTISTTGSLTSGIEVLFSFDIGVRVNSLLADKDPLDFGTVQVGQSKEIQLTLTNDTQTDVNAVLLENPFNSPPFVVVPATQALQDGESFTFTITFQPKTVGTFTRTLDISAGPGGLYDTTVQILAKSFAE